jgi:hypothetical protein
MTDDNGEFLPPDPAALVAETQVAGEDEPVPELSPAVEALMQTPGVVMTGETLDARGNKAILVGVKTKRDLAKVPAEIDGLPVVTQVIGDVVAYDTP